MSLTPVFFSIGFLVLFVILMIVAKIVLKRKEADSTDSRAEAKSDSYVLKPSLLTPAERSFFGVLESFELEGMTLVSKVRLADIFEVRPGVDRGPAKSAFNRISAKHVDFLLLRQSDCRPVLGIELDDASHRRADRKNRDQFVDDVFKSAGLPLLHIKAQAAYDPAEIHRQISAAMNPPNATAA